MTASQPASEQSIKNLLKASLAVAAPAIVPFVMLVSVNSVAMLSLTGLGRLGMAAAGVVILCLANFFWKGRWWAALPSLAAFVGGMAAFAFKFVRPFMAYVKANPINDIGDLGTPFMMLSPSLVVIVICFTLGLVTWRGIKTARELSPRPIGRLVMGLFCLWLAVLGGDLFYQQGGWRYFNHPSALMVRMCQGDQNLAAEARQRLLHLGPAAVDDLLLGVKASDPDLDCLRDNSRRVLMALGVTAGEPLLQKALEGDPVATSLLGEIGFRKAVDKLLERYRQPAKGDSPGFRASLKQAIEKLDPTVKL